MQKTIDGITYTVIPTTPSLSPYMTLIGQLLQTVPKTVEEAEINSTQLSKAMDKLFEGTVTPKPKLEHHIPLYKAVSDETQKALKEAQFFCEPTGTSAEKSGSTRTSPA